MKFLSFCALLIGSVAVFSSCQKVLSPEFGTAQGTLKADAGGDCLPVLINGSYRVDTLLNAQNYADVQVNITSQGAYTISTDTLNGYYFNAAGSADTGLHVIRLQAVGRPFAFGSGVDVFHVRFNGTTCEINVVLSGGTAPPPPPPPPAMDSIHISLNGGVTYSNFNITDSAFFSTQSGYSGYNISGYSATGEYVQFAVAVPGASVPTGTPYDVNMPPTASVVYGEYDDSGFNTFTAQTASTNPTPYFTVTLTSTSATKVTGTFSGALYDSGTGPATKNIMGNFSVTIY